KPRPRRSWPGCCDKHPARSAAPSPGPVVRGPLMNRWFILFLCFWAAPAPSASAQPERFALGQRLRAFEAAWDEQSDAAARRRAVEPLNRTVAAFCRFRPGEAGQALDQARFALRPAQPPAAERWAASLFVRPDARLIDAAQMELPVTVAPFYTVTEDRPMDTALRLTLTGAGKQAVAGSHQVALGSLPQEVKLTLKGLAEEDYLLRAEILVSGKPAAVSELTVSSVPRLQRRLDKLKQAVEALPPSPRTTDKESLRALVRLLETLA